MYRIRNQNPAKTLLITFLGFSQIVVFRKVDPFPRSGLIYSTLTRQGGLFHYSCILKIILYLNHHTKASGSNQKLIFNDDRLIGLQKLIFWSDHRFSILYDPSFHFPTIFQFFLTMKKDRFHHIKNPLGRLWGS